MKVGIRASNTKATPAKNFAQMICQSDKGLVTNISMVPVRFSSAKLRIVTAGTKNRKTQGARMKRLSKLA